MLYRVRSWAYQNHRNIGTIHPVGPIIHCYEFMVSSHDDDLSVADLCDEEHKHRRIRLHDDYIWASLPASAPIPSWWPTPTGRQLNSLGRE